jgi:hypothetical protein
MILSSLVNYALINQDKQLQVYDEISKTSDILTNLMNMQTTAAMVGLHNALKKEIMEMLDTSINNSGKAIIESFKTASLKKVESKK